MSRQPDDAFEFEGFSTQRYTQIPNTYFDHLMQQLTPSENMVILYIFRRTFGFGKDSDAISLTQMAEGITARDGRVLDRGTGMSRPGCRKGIQGLLDKGIITVQKAIAEDGNNEVNIYRLRFKAGEVPPGWVVNDVNQGGKQRFPVGVVNDVNQGRQRNELGVVNDVNPHEQRIQKKVKQQHPPQAARVANRVVVSSSESIKTPDHEHQSPLLESILALGVSEAVAIQLLKDHAEPELREQLAALPYRPAKEPAAVFVKALKAHWALPKTYTDTVKKTAKAQEKQAVETAAAVEKAAAAAVEAERSHQVDEYLAELTELERSELETLARTELEETGQGRFWRGQMPATILKAQVRLMVRQRLGLDEPAE